MSAQEFSSPGEHMASMSGSGSSSNGLSSSQTIFAPSSDFSDIEELGDLIFSGGSSGSSAHSNSLGGFDVSSVLSFVQDYINTVNTMQARNNQYAQDSMDAQNEYNTNSAQKAMDFSAEQAQINRDFQERMSNTSYQRGVQDLEKAGLNPILAYMSAGASSPTGASASGVSSSSATPQIDQGYGSVGLITSMISNIKDLMLSDVASDVWNKPGVQKLFNNTLDTANTIAETLGDGVKEFNNVVEDFNNNGIKGVLKGRKNRVDKKKFDSNIKNAKNNSNTSYFNPVTNSWS